MQMPILADDYTDINTTILIPILVSVWYHYKCMVSVEHYGHSQFWCFRTLCARAQVPCYWVRARVSFHSVAPLLLVPINLHTLPPLLGEKNIWFSSKISEMLTKMVSNDKNDLLTPKNIYFLGFSPYIQMCKVQSFISVHGLFCGIFVATPDDILWSPSNFEWGRHNGPSSHFIIKHSVEIPYCDNV